MIKSGSTAWQIIKPGVDLGLIDSIIITYKTLPGYGSRVLLQKRYPDDTRVNGDELLLPLSQADTTLLREEGGDRVRLELQYNFTSGAVAKSEIQTVHIGDTLATAFVDGSNPDEAQIEGRPIEFSAGDAIVIESKNKCVKDWNENDPTSPKYIEGRTHYKICVFHSEMNKPNTHDGWHQIDKPGEGVSLLIDGTDVPDYWWPRYTELSNVIAEAHGTFEAEIRLGFPEDSAYADRTMEYKIGPGNLKNAKYLTMLDDKNYTVNFIGTSTPYQLQIAIIVDTTALVEENKAVYPVRGIYFVCEGVDALPSGSHVTMVRTGIFRYYPLDPKYIPDEIARTADVVARQQLAADAGKALVIGEDGVVKVGEVGGGSLVVEIIQNDFGFTTSHTSQEIYAAHTAGKTVQAHVFGRYAPCVNAYEHAAYFEQEDIETGAVRKLRATISDNEADVQYIDYTPPVTSVNGQTGDVKVSGSLIVTITENDDGTLTPSHTSQEIYAAYTGGKSVMMYVYNDIIPLEMVFAPDYVQFAKIASDGVETMRLAVWIRDDQIDLNVGGAIPPMTPATADEDGASGLVPAPAAGQQDMVLHGDGTWREVEGGGGWRRLSHWEKDDNIVIQPDAFDVTTGVYTVSSGHGLAGNISVAPYLNGGNPNGYYAKTPAQIFKTAYLSLIVLSDTTFKLQSNGADITYTTTQTVNPGAFRFESAEWMAGYKNIAEVKGLDDYEELLIVTHGQSSGAEIQPYIMPTAGLRHDLSWNDGWRPIPYMNANGNTYGEKMDALGKSDIIYAMSIYINNVAGYSMHRGYSMSFNSSGNGARKTVEHINIFGKITAAKIMYINSLANGSVFDVYAR